MTTPTKPDSKQISVVFTGRRFLDGKVYNEFRHGDRRLHFAKIRWARIGNHYFATESADGFVSMSQAPEEDTGAGTASESDIEQWQVKDVLARDMQQRKKLAARMDKSPALDRAVEAIIPLTKGLGFNSTRQLLEILITKALRQRNQEE